MALIRWEPVREAQTIQQEMNHLFGSFFDSPTARVATTARRWVPAMDVVEEADHYVLSADLPGLDEQDVKVELDGELLTISGERRSEYEERGQGYRRVERASGSFSRSLTLPEGVEADAIEASFEKGVLEVRVPKPQQRKPHRVAINADAKSTVVEGAEGASNTADAA